MRDRGCPLFPAGHGMAILAMTHFHAKQFRLLLRRWPLFLAGWRGPSWATSGCEYADQPAGDGGQDRGERVRHRDPVVDERRPGDGPDDEVQAKGRHDRDIQPIGEAAGVASASPLWSRGLLLSLCSELRSLR